MKTTETKKDIMELLKPYMDKALCVGCYIIDIDGYNNPIVRIQDTVKGRGANGKSDLLGDDGNYYHSSWLKKNKEYIIGHYDMTAVLNYFQDKGKKIGIEGGFFTYTYYVKSIAVTFKFLAKPLSLYTEKEERDLEEILTGLK